MSQCGFKELFSDLIYNLRKIEDCPVSENYEIIQFFEKIYSLVFISAFVFFVLFKKKVHGPDYFNQLKDSSIFVILDDYYRIVYIQHDSFDVILTKNNDNFYDFLDMLDCCKTRCCIRIMTPISHMLKRFLLPIQKFLWKNSKSICFYLVVFGYFFFSSVEYLTSFLTAPCLIDNANIFQNPLLLTYGFIDLIISSCTNFVFTFMISFISTRRELLSFHPNDIKGKAFFFHYHVKKGLIFALLGFLVKLLLMIISGHTFFDMSLDPASNVFWMARAIFFLFLIRWSHSRKRVQISCNCEYLKEESKFFQIQNFLYKHRWNFEKMMNFKTKKEVLMDNLKSKLKEDVSLKFGLFKEMVAVLENQKFKNVIIKKNVVDSGYPAFLATLLMCYFGYYIVVTVLSTLTLMNSRSLTESCFLNSVMVCYNLTDFFEVICFPYLFYMTTRKDNFYL